MSIMVNFFDGNPPNSPTGQPNQVLGAQIGNGELVADGAQLSAVKDAPMLVKITGMSKSWVRIGAAAVANECEPWDVDKEEVRYLAAGDDIYCIART